MTPRTPLLWRVALLAGVAALAATAYLTRYDLGSQARACMGIVAFIGFAAAFSTDLRRLPWRTLAVGMLLQLTLALLILRVDFVFAQLQSVGAVVQQFLDSAGAGAAFVFGPLANPPAMDKVHGPGQGFVFATVVLPAIIFVSAFFSLLYHFGILQAVVRVMSAAIQRPMGVSGPEALSGSANVFMGQTEAPLIVKPYIEKMSRSQVLAVMIGGMATVSGGMMVIFIGMTGASAAYFLATSVMAAPCGLYMAKLLYPEDDPAAAGRMKEPIETEEITLADRLSPAKIIDAITNGATDGLKLALNVAAMLIAFVAFIKLIDVTLEPIGTSLGAILGTLFAPGAALIGIEGADVNNAGRLLGTKLVGSELLAFQQMATHNLPGGDQPMSARSVSLMTFALTGFANFASIGIQIGGIGAMAPNQRKNLASLGMRALFGGFLATMINASIAAILL